jgi:mono/diheme cytochrome c family protein
MPAARPRRWTAALLVAGGLASPGCARARPSADPDAAPPARQQKTAGALLFAEHCARCHGSLGEGKGDAPRVIGESALARFGTAQELHDYVAREMPKDRPGALDPRAYWAIVAFDARANGSHLDDATLGPDNAASLALHRELDLGADEPGARLAARE